MKRLALALALALAACSAENNVTERHIIAANQVCQNNGGVASIRKAYAQGETQNCGYRCLKATGRFLYSGNVECHNGAYFHLNFTE